MQRGGIYLFLFIIFFITNVGKGFAVTNMESSFHFENIDYQTNSNTEEGLSFHNYHFLSFNLSHFIISVSANKKWSDGIQESDSLENDSKYIRLNKTLLLWIGLLIIGIFIGATYFLKGKPGDGALPANDRWKNQHQMDVQQPGWFCRWRAAIDDG